MGVLTLVLLPVLTTLLVVLGPAGEAHGLSCAGWPSDDPVAMYADRLPDDAPPTEAGIPEWWDGAVVGTVTDVRGPGPVAVVVDVDATLGARLGRQVVLESPDAGEMSGYPFEVGRRYVVPYTVDDGVLHSFACDPVLPVADDQVAPMLAAAEAGDWSGHVHPPVVTSDDGTPPAGSPGTGVVLAGAATVGAVGLGLSLGPGLRRRRRSGR